MLFVNLQYFYFLKMCSSLNWVAAGYVKSGAGVWEVFTYLNENRLSRDCVNLSSLSHTSFFLVFCVNLLTAGNLSTILSLLSIIQSPVGKSLELMQRPKWPSVEDDLWWKTNFGGRRPSVEDDLLWKTPFVGTRPSVEDYLWWKTTLVGSLHTSYSALRHFLSKDLVQIFQLHRICVQYDMMVIM